MREVSFKEQGIRMRNIVSELSRVDRDGGEGKQNITIVLMMMTSMTRKKMKMTTSNGTGQALASIKI